MKKHYLLFLLIASIFLLGSCKDDANDTPTSGQFSTGIFVVNEGVFNSGNASISHYDTDNDSLTANIFEAVNGRPLGDVAQSMTIHEGYAYIVVNNSNKIEVVNASTFEEVATITGLAFPRYFLGIDATKGYVSEWGADGVSGNIRIIDLETFTVKPLVITTAGGAPEHMTSVGTKVYVGHTGGYGLDSIITIIDPFTDLVDSELELGYNPAQIAKDYNGKPWVLVKGYTNWNTYEAFPAYLKRLNPATYEEELSFELPSNYPSSLHISADGTELFFLSGGAVVAQDVDAIALDLRTINADTYYYSLGYDTSSNRLYAGDAIDYVSQGIVYILGEDGSDYGSFTAGVIPGYFSTQN